MADRNRRDRKGKASKSSYMRAARKQRMIENHFMAQIEKDREKETARSNEQIRN